MTQEYTTLRDLINTILPERVERLEFGCEIDICWVQGQPTERVIWGTREFMTENGKDEVMEDNISGTIVKYYGKPVTITDILLALSEKKITKFAFALLNDGTIELEDRGFYARFDITLPLSHEANREACEAVTKLLTTPLKG